MKSQGNTQFAKWNLKGLEDLKKSFKQPYEVHVGILKETASRTNKNNSGMNNAELGALMELGSFTKSKKAKKRIPARSWLKAPIKKIKPHINKFFNENKRNLKESFEKRGGTRALFSSLGKFCVSVIKGGFNSGGYGAWDRNAPATIRKKGRDTPLKETRQLKNAVTYRVVNKNGSKTKSI